MDQLYALGIKLIVLIQERFGIFEGHFIAINFLADPNHGYTFICPFVATIDSVFGAQCFVTIATANWMNVILKWGLSEHRPYWWIKETTYYTIMQSKRPVLRMSRQTCETGPGSPSGHVMYMTCLCILFGSWLIATLFKSCSPAICKILSFILFIVTAVVLSLISTARMFIATHFPHQCLVGFLCGVAVLNIVNNLIVYPSVTPRSNDAALKTYNPKQLWINAMFVVVVLASSVALYWILKYYGIDPQWTIKMAFKWCPKSEFISVTTTPLFSLVQSVGTLIGFVLCASPSLQRHRYNTEEISMQIQYASSLFFYISLFQIESNVSRDNVAYFYLSYAASYAVRAVVFLRVVPAFAAMRSYWEERFRAPALETTGVPDHIRSRSI